MERPERRWQVASTPPPEFLAANLDYPSVVSQILWNRGFHERAAAARFLRPDFTAHLHDPFLFRDMARAVERVRQAIVKKELVVVHGDYDADGVCGAAVLWTTLRALGARADVFLPHREHDGYGLHEKNVREIAERGARLIITCDCGISNAKEIALAASLGVDVIITDHHTLPPELPPALAILHPLVPGETYPWNGLSGGGVAFKFAQALLRTMPLAGDPGFEKWLLDLVAISSVADMVPLRDETRTLVHYGLKVLARTRRKGLQTLMESAGVRLPITTTTIGFQIAPRINAAGRMEHASIAFEALTTNDHAEADRLAEKLQQCNIARQRAVTELMTEARERVSGDSNSPIVVSGLGWRLGLLGLIASKLAEEHRRPTFAFADRDGVLTGSGRSIPGLDLMNALRTMPEVMTKFGGHAQACGVTLDREQLPAFSSALTAAVQGLALNTAATPALTIDAEILADELNQETADILENFAPFGMENPEPAFLLKSVIVRMADTVGADGKHLRILGEHCGAPRKFIGFRLGNRLAEIVPGGRIDAVCNLRTSEWNGRRELECVLLDFRS